MERRPVMARRLALLKVNEAEVAHDVELAVRVKRYARLQMLDAQWIPACHRDLATEKVETVDMLGGPTPRAVLPALVPKDAAALSTSP